MKTTEELLQIIKEPYRFQANMVVAASYELEVRAVDVTDTLLERDAIYEENEALLSEGKEGSVLYLVICFVLALLGGFLGIASGYIYGFSKTTSYSGKSFYVYDAYTRKYGRIIFRLGLVIVVLVVVTRIFSTVDQR